LGWKKKKKKHQKQRNKERREAPYYKRKDHGERQRGWELKMISFNVRGLNPQSKQKAVEKLIYQETPHILCFNETRLQAPL